MPKYRKGHTSHDSGSFYFGILGVGGVKETHDKNDEIVKCETTTFRSFGYRELEESRVETLHHRSPEVVKCETPKS
jgi:hypothetical protein